LTVFVGLIGAGNISDTHARALAELPGAEIAAVYAPTAPRAEQFTARYGGTPYDSLEQMLAQRPLDMVVIGTPSACTRTTARPRPSAACTSSSRSRSM
jgi:Predicted dehydrogenases and related proteins